MICPSGRQQAVRGSHSADLLSGRVTGSSPRPQTAHPGPAIGCQFGGTRVALGRGSALPLHARLVRVNSWTEEQNSQVTTTLPSLTISARSFGGKAFQHRGRRVARARALRAPCAAAEHPHAAFVEQRYNRRSPDRSGSISSTSSTVPIATGPRPRRHLRRPHATPRPRAHRRDAGRPAAPAPAPSAGMQQHAAGAPAMFHRRRRRAIPRRPRAARGSGSVRSEGNIHVRRLRNCRRRAPPDPDSGSCPCP